jgi:glycosyltransferase involved in cell wall biosynthesis
VDKIIAQNDKQKKGFARVYGKQSELIKSFITLPEFYAKNDRRYILWVGNDLPKKKAYLFVKLSLRLPQYRFKMIMSKTCDRYSQPIIALAKEVPNLDFLGFVPFSEIHAHFQEASLFVSTSIREGFPNTFLQSWQYATPVLSLSVDPDDVIVKYNIGKVCGTFDTLCRQIDVLMRNDSERHIIGQNALSYVRRDHSREMVLKKYLSVFSELGI